VAERGTTKEKERGQEVQRRSIVKLRGLVGWDEVEPKDWERWKSPGGGMWKNNIIGRKIKGGGDEGSNKRLPERGHFRREEKTGQKPEVKDHQPVGHAPDH